MVEPWTIRYTAGAEKDIQYWYRQDKKTIRRILKLVESIEENPYFGLGKPEPLRYMLENVWSRRIDTTNRLVYRVNEDSHLVVIEQARYHYSNR